ncbi:MAG: DsrE family protein [Gammaproteobacteria bacterium]|nr:DsrE family protein [Gammaproteobacteria bacterium]
MKPVPRTLITVLAVLLFPLAAAAGFRAELEQLLGGDRPDGVVFEIATGDAGALEWALPRTDEAIRKLRAKWPDLEIVIVSHGKEQFALTRDSVGKKEVKKQVLDLVSKDKVSVHVCGAFASMNNVSEDAFPDHINVSAHGPEQIKDYQSLGYRLIRLSKDD